MRFANYYKQMPAPSILIWGVVLLVIPALSSPLQRTRSSPLHIRGQISAERHRWEEAVTTFRTHSTVEQALKKQIITVFEPMYLEILNNDIVGFANTSAK
jgi:hypothetical protein